jgi:hypothetical protein
MNQAHEQLRQFVNIVRQEATQGYRALTNIEEIVDTLNQVTSPFVHKTIAHYEDKSFQLTKVGRDVSLLLLNGEGTKVMKPTVFEAFYFPHKPPASFFRLGYKGIVPRNILPFDAKEDMYTPQGNRIIPVETAEQSYVVVDKNGTQIPFQGGDHTTRILQDGHFIFTSKGSPLNNPHNTNQRNDLMDKGKESRTYRNLMTL